jgi:hypothetical protein
MVITISFQKHSKYFHMKSRNDKNNYDYNILSNLIPYIWTLIIKKLFFHLNLVLWLINHAPSNWVKPQPNCNICMILK